jgi:hypothetical protein
MGNLSKHNMTTKIAAAIMSVMCGSMLCFGQTGSATASAASQEILFVQFAGGGTPLTAPERTRIGQIVAEAQSNPQVQWNAVQQRHLRVLAAVQSGGSSGPLWDAVRYLYVQPEAMGTFARGLAEEKQIVEAHDPVIASDPAHHRIVTQHMMPAIRFVATWSATTYGLAQPGADFDGIVRQRLPQLSAQDEPVADGFAHVARYAPYLNAYFARMPAPDRARFVTSSRKTFNHLDQPGMEAWEISQSGAMVARFAALHSGAATSGSADMLMNSYLGTNAVRGYSPACNPTLSGGTRVANNCSAPLPGLP